MIYTKHQPNQTQNAHIKSQLIHAQVVDFIDKSPNSRNSPRVERKAKQRLPVHLKLIGNGSPNFIGVHAVPGRLPELLRLPGESAAAFSDRALHYVTGTGAIWARLMYASEEGAQNFRGPSVAFPMRVMRGAKTR